MEVGSERACTEALREYPPKVVLQSRLHLSILGLMDRDKTTPGYSAFSASSRRHFQLAASARREHREVPGVIRGSA